MFDGRIIFDGIATAKNFVVGSYFPGALQVKKKSDANFSPVTLSTNATCAAATISTENGKSGKTAVFHPNFSV
jgi:hypothetical protein